jgi:transposase
MESLEEHYEHILRLPSGWYVEGVETHDKKEQVEIYIEYSRVTCECSGCGRTRRIYDRRPKRKWRHLNMLQYQSHLVCELPRTTCDTCGILTVEIPWADPGLNFTHMFEAHAIDVLLAARSTAEATVLMRCSWYTLDLVKKRAVARGLVRRDDYPIDYVALDEKHYGRGQKYAAILYSLDGGEVLEISEGRTCNSTENLIKEGLSRAQRHHVKAVAMDMWQPFAQAVAAQLPSAAVVHDKFHIMAHLNKSIDQVRRAEHRERSKQGDKRLAGSRYDWLRNSETLKDASCVRVGTLLKAGFKVARAWLLREVFRGFWESEDRQAATHFWKGWHSKAIRSRLTPVKNAARMIQRHIESILNYFDHPITTGRAEGINSKIQTVQSNARGFRSFASLRTNILFYCGKLELRP